MSTSPPKFAIIPSAEELANVDRDLHFQPVTNSSPQILSCEQIAHYNQYGYLKQLPVFSSSEMVSHRKLFDQLLAETIAAGGDSYSISTAHMTYGAVYDLLCHPKIVAYVRDLLGDDVIGWGSHYFCKMPRDGKSVAWHQDVSYWPLSHARTATVWLAIDDVDRENACVRFIPGSHRHGHLPYRESSMAEENVLDQTVDNIERFGEPVDVEMAAGEISIHSDLLLHGSEANNSDRRRCGLTLRYCTPEVLASLDWHLKGVVVSGRDTSGRWGNPSRPN